VRPGPPGPGRTAVSRGLVAVLIRFRRVRCRVSPPSSSTPAAGAAAREAAAVPRIRLRPAGRRLQHRVAHADRRDGLGGGRRRDRGGGRRRRRRGNRLLWRPWGAGDWRIRRRPGRQRQCRRRRRTTRPAGTAGQCGAGGIGEGGAIYSTGTLSISNSVITDATAGAGDGGPVAAPARAALAGRVALAAPAPKAALRARAGSWVAPAGQAARWATAATPSAGRSSAPPRCQHSKHLLGQLRRGRQRRYGRVRLRGRQRWQRRHGRDGRARRTGTGAGDRRRGRPRWERRDARYGRHEGASGMAAFPDIDAPKLSVR
jgi:hypothetical protein